MLIFKIGSVVRYTRNSQPRTVESISREGVTLSGDMFLCQSEAEMLEVICV